MILWHLLAEGRKSSNSVYEKAGWIHKKLALVVYHLAKLNLKWLSLNDRVATHGFLILLLLLLNYLHSSGIPVKTSMPHSKPNLSNTKAKIAILSEADPIQSPVMDSVCRRELKMAMKCLRSDSTHRVTMWLSLSASPVHVLMAQYGTGAAAEQPSTVIFALQGWIF